MNSIENLSKTRIVTSNAIMTSTWSKASPSEMLKIMENLMDNTINDATWRTTNNATEEFINEL